ncbi:hypothetical protein BO78DRAFT_70283 [Aspergillus sclerotiicarbonarius CBS 121057]|uniref:Zn(2)-C6 fungal-type domain-containing protein n=1 Tax=Aspergillus sclerotiicarbonarius (strain CBS 121057 / IBT 28362) TaxID=1448318 RepID=A0A319F7L4_ASPSB|nr:hypothetical protein BO78DRAFT_70283 [Aspergillus sclerotiicarbonarius CBS 121057]
MNPKKRPLPSPDADLLPACNQCRSRKVRCDRVQPECSTCRKTNVPCDFSASFKRVNPAKQLLHDFSTVLARLDHVDRTLTQLSQKVDALSPQSTGAALTTTTGTAWPEPANDGAAEEIVTKQVLELGDIGERLYGYPAALCLFRSSQKLLWTALGGYPNIAPLPGAVAMAADQPSLRPSLVRHYEIFPFRGKCIELPLVRDQSPILLPPLAVLESAVPSYLENINSQVPVFDADSLHAAIQTCYQTPNSVIGSIWAVCFNCIVLLAWNLEARVAQRVKSLVDPWDNKGITALLLSNCRRGLADLQRFSQPALGSLQALILLTLVAREFFVSAVFEKACQTSCHVARSMGLGRSIETLDHVEDSVQLRTRERLFWALYSLDKQRVFLSGHSCDLYLFDSGLQPPRCSSEMPATSQLQFASVQMMTIWEEIYLCLYSSRAARFRVDHRRDQIRALRRLYADFSRQQEELLSSSFLTRAPDLGMMQLELRYRYHVGQILIYRCDPSEESQKETRKHSVLALRMISDVFHAPVTANSCAVLSRTPPSLPFTICAWSTLPTPPRMKPPLT